MENFPTFGPELRTLEQKIGKGFEHLSIEQQAELTNSWQALEELITRLEKTAQPEVMARTQKVGYVSDEQAKQAASEIHQFYAGFFTPAENTDPKTHEISIREKVFDTYLGRDERDNLASILQTQLVKLSNTKSIVPEVVFVTWYVATSKDYHGKPMTRELFIRALRDVLANCQQKLTKIKVLLGETEDAVEIMFNRYGMKRLYFQDESSGAMRELPFAVPPEDESTSGVPEHLMLHQLDGQNEIGKEELLNLIKDLFKQYTRSEYFTVEALRASQQYYNSVAEHPGEIEEWEINPITATAYRLYYSGIVRRISQKLNKQLAGVNGNLFGLTERERRQWRLNGTTVVDWDEEEAKRQRPRQTRRGL